MGYTYCVQDMCGSAVSFADAEGIVEFINSLARLSSTAALKLHSTDLQGIDVVARLQGLTSLALLRLTWTGIETCQIPSGLCNLSELCLSNNCLLHPPHNMSLLPSLKVLHLDDQNVNFQLDASVEMWADLPHL